MTIDEKLSYLNSYCKANSLWSACSGFADGDYNYDPSLPAFLRKKSFIKEKEFEFLEALRKIHNTWDYRHLNSTLNKEGILYINLLYNILQKNNL